MFAILLLLAAPSVPRTDIVQCKTSFDELERYVATINELVWRNDLDRGGHLTWSEGNDIRNEVRKTARPYLDRIRLIGWEGRARECTELSRDGQRAVFQTAKKYFK